MAILHLNGTLVSQHLYIIMKVASFLMFHSKMEVEFSVLLSSYKSTSEITNIKLHSNVKGK